MNIVHLRQIIPNFASVLPISPEGQRKLLHAPLFVVNHHYKPTEEEWKECMKLVCWGENLMFPKYHPFPEYIIRREIGSPNQRTTEFFLTSETQMTFLLFLDEFKDRGLAAFTSLDTSTMKCFGRAQKFKLNGDYSHFENEVVAPLVKQQFVLQCLFLFELQYTGSHMVKVTPTKQGKSIQWRQSREHYLIMHKRDIIACQQGKRSPTDHELVRAAHRRIAHFRLLKHPRYVLKCGQRIPVKSAWIGPREWEGTDGKIYAVVDSKH